jgi:glutamate--cysteine ligase
MREWAGELLSGLGNAATLLDTLHGGADYAAALTAAQAKLADDSLTPSGRMLQQMQDENLSFAALALKLSQQQCDALKPEGLTPEQEALFTTTALESLQKQASIEAEPQEPFEVFLAQWNEASL